VEHSNSDKTFYPPSLLVDSLLTFQLSLAAIMSLEPKMYVPDEFFLLNLTSGYETMLCRVVFLHFYKNLHFLHIMTLHIVYDFLFFVSKMCHKLIACIKKSPAYNTTFKKK